MTQAPERKNRKKLRPVWMLAILDILMAGVILCVFALFHHVIPRIRLELEGQAAPIADLRPAATAQPDLASPAPAPIQADGEPEEEPEVPLTWREKFAEHFTDTVVVTENSYTSPDISVTITTHTKELSTGPVIYYVADIYVANLESFISGSPGEGHHTAYPERFSRDNDAILAVNGDFAANQSSGLYVRNGALYMEGDNFCDICVLYYDGTVETYEPGEYTQEEILARSPYQIWKFGPELLDDGIAKTEFNTTDALLRRNPRTGFGYYEPGHYCFIVADGRQRQRTMGASQPDFAVIFEELGCVRAYSLDGGASTVMTFMGEIYNNPNETRKLADMLVIREIPAADSGEETP